MRRSRCTFVSTREPFGPPVKSMHTAFLAILLLGVAWIAGYFVWTSTAVVVAPASAVEEGMTTMDAVAREGQTCRAVEILSDPEGRLELVDESCESGLPHTSDANTIRIPRTLWLSASETTRNSILRHERVHLHQRRNPAAWTDFYSRHWQYRTHRDPPESMPRDAVDGIRANPDTESSPWNVWRGRYWFVPVYNNPAKPEIRQTTVRVWDEQVRTWLEEPPVAWKAQFCSDRYGCPHQFEHPAEIAAELWTNGDATTDAAPGAIPLFDFLRNQ
jgi:hypothetical protein